MKPADFFLTEEALGWVNELLPGAGPIGAYAMAMACVAFHQRGIPLIRFALEAMRQQTSLADAAEWLEKYFQDVEAVSKRRRKRGLPAGVDGLGQRGSAGIKIK